MSSLARPKERVNGGPHSGTRTDIYIYQDEREEKMTIPCFSPLHELQRRAKAGSLEHH